MLCFMKKQQQNVKGQSFCFMIFECILKNTLLRVIISQLTVTMCLGLICQIMDFQPDLLEGIKAIIKTQRINIFSSFKTFITTLILKNHFSQ